LKVAEKLFVPLRPRGLVKVCLFREGNPNS